jgi:hypothetical protein
MMSSQSPHPDTSPDLQKVRRIANRQNQQQHWLSGNSQLPCAKRRVFVPAGGRDSSSRRELCSLYNPRSNFTPLSSLNNSCVADNTQSVTSTPSAKQRWSIITPIATPGRSCRNTLAPSGITHSYPTHRVLSIPASGIASTPTPLSGLENLHTPIPNPEARVIITNPLQL